MKIFSTVLALVLATTLAAAAGMNQEIKVYSVSEGKYVMTEKVEKSRQEWQQSLTPEQFHVLREQGTERAFSNPLHNNHREGIYRCAGCGLDLFSSQAKYDSGTGWPSFYQPVAKENVGLKEDRSFFMTRTEVVCPRCGGHLGHVFNDGPQPTGQRYCMNGAALTFVPADEVGSDKREGGMK